MVIDVHVTIDQYYETLLLLGGTPVAGMHPNRRMVQILPTSTANVANMNQNLSSTIRATIAKLDAALAKFGQRG